MDLPLYLSSLPQIQLGEDVWVGVAADPWSRFRGLMGVKAIPGNWGLLINGCSSVHTFWMRFALDLIWLDRDHNVLAVNHNVRPCRMSWRRGATSVLEVSAGSGDLFIELVQATDSLRRQFVQMFAI